MDSVRKGFTIFPFTSSVPSGRSVAYFCLASLNRADILESFKSGYDAVFDKIRYCCHRYRLPSVSDPSTRNGVRVGSEACLEREKWIYNLLRGGNQWRGGNGVVKVIRGPPGLRIKKLTFLEK